MEDNFLKELWRYRELLYFFAWRDVKVRYRQAAFGAGWAIVQPLMSMVMFTVLFGRLAHMPSENIPYPIFCYCALVPWTYFSTVLGLASLSLTNNSSLIEKVYFPRVLLPAGTALAGILDFIIGSVLLVGMMVYYRVRPGPVLLFLPVVILMMILLTTGISMLAAAVNVRYRDVKYVLPFVLQVWMFVTPIIYPVTIIPAQYRKFMVLNPCWGIVDGFRACIFPKVPINLTHLLASLAVTVVIFIAGMYYFQRAERSFADVI
jgi:homopolymeric O-antigen transport system permease protein